MELIKSRTREFPTSNSNRWIFGAYVHWYTHIRDTTKQLDNYDYHRWFNETYNMDWDQYSTGVRITSYNDADWVRFQLEFQE